MDTSLAHENARLRALLQTQQDTIRQMAEYNRLLSLRIFMKGDHSITSIEIG
ncbi:hypothetical protein LHL10_10185 [Escherichia coli]|uniref:hypothetical protein n=1 Tax=Escherichia coli TaxID=562 RepID=UPI001CF7F585|nr:hypothetical protein [Escherichia coli]MCB4570772.1 hypothetical protein [Escherichia coli]